MLDDRKKRVLQAIVEEYINTAEPVSSASIVKNHNLKFSSATIRNDMADLEQHGYLDKPHTSAGRIPSSIGYRFYVDKLLRDDDISLQEIEYIKSKLQTKVNEIEELTKIVTSTLSEITHYTSLAIGPKADMHNIMDIKFVLLGSRVLMAVILTDAGTIKETLIKFNADITESQVESINYIFNQKLRGMPLSKIDKPMQEYILSEMNYELKIIKPIIEQINIELENNSKIYLEGTNRTFEFPEFKSYETARKFLKLLDTKDIVLELLNHDFAQDINVYIGDENENEDLKDFSIITFKHSVDGKELGTIGIIGPTRMDYSKVISVMRYINRKLNERK